MKIFVMTHANTEFKANENITSSWAFKSLDEAKKDALEMMTYGDPEDDDIELEWIEKDEGVFAEFQDDMFFIKEIEL